MRAGRLNREARGFSTSKPDGRARRIPRAAHLTGRLWLPACLSILLIKPFAIDCVGTEPDAAFARLHCADPGVLSRWLCWSERDEDDTYRDQDGRRCQKSCPLARNLKAERPHHECMCEARPGSEGDQAPMCGWIPHGEEQENTQAGVDGHLHGIASVGMHRVQ